MSDWIHLLVKFKGKCTECGKEIPAGEYALWSKSSKAIRHERCEVLKPKNKEEGQPQAVPELDCFICGMPAGCAVCGFEADCDRQVVSHACVCSQCLEDGQVYVNYQQAFVKKAHRVAKVKI